jgi:hypothetical protein
MFDLQHKVGIFLTAQKDRGYEHVRRWLVADVNQIKRGIRVGIANTVRALVYIYLSRGSSL